MVGQGARRCPCRFVILADLFIRKSIVPEAVGGKIHLVRPCQAEAAAKNTHLANEVTRLLQRGKKFSALDVGCKIDNAARAVGPGDGDGVVGVRYRVFDFVKHGQSTIF